MIMLFQIQKDEMSMQALNFTRIRAQEKKRADYKIEKLRTAALETENDVQKIQARRLVLENYLRNEVGERKIETTGKSMSLMELLQVMHDLHIKNRRFLYLYRFRNSKRRFPDVDIRSCSVWCTILLSAADSAKTAGLRQLALGRLFRGSLRGLQLGSAEAEERQQ